jgi:hypothetical protein
MRSIDEIRARIERLRLIVEDDAEYEASPENWSMFVGQLEVLEWVLGEE